MSKNPYTVIASQTEKHGRFTDDRGILFCKADSCDFAVESDSRSKRTRSHARHVAHHVKKALIAEGMLPAEEEVAAA